jgi:uncharacterized membrane protein HdeD (DUF308 family)
MSHVFAERYREPLRHELSELRANWVWILALGVLTIALGVIMIGAPFVANLGTMLFLSTLLIVGGIAQMVGAFWVRRWSGFFLQLLAGVLYLVLGIVTIERPLEFSAVLTRVIAAFLIAGGISRIFAAVALRFEGWIWPVLSGVISVLLGLMIWRQWPLSGLYVIGLFLGVEMLFQGITWVMVSLALRSLPKVETPTTTAVLT